MTQKVLDVLVESARTAALNETPTAALTAVLHNSFSNADAIAQEISEFDDDEVMLFEDSTCSIWSCRYDPDIVFAPHEHCMNAHIAVYRGAEV